MKRIKNLFDCLASIGATVEPIWDGEWDGPIMFKDDKGNQALLLIKTKDHKDFDKLIKKQKFVPVKEARIFARKKLVEIAKRILKITKDGYKVVK